jgi:hypothetical protein
LGKRNSEAEANRKLQIEMKENEILKQKRTENCSEK